MLRKARVLKMASACPNVQICSMCVSKFPYVTTYMRSSVAWHFHGDDPPVRVKSWAIASRLASKSENNLSLFLRLYGVKSLIAIFGMSRPKGHRVVVRAMQSERTQQSDLLCCHMKFLARTVGRVLEEREHFNMERKCIILIADLLHHGRTHPAWMGKRCSRSAIVSTQRGSSATARNVSLQSWMRTLLSTSTR